MGRGQLDRPIRWRLRVGYLRRQDRRIGRHDHACGQPARLTDVSNAKGPARGPRSARSVRFAGSSSRLVTVLVGALAIFVGLRANRLQRARRSWDAIMLASWRTTRGSGRREVAYLKTS